MHATGVRQGVVSYIPPEVRLAKRALDIIGGLAATILLAPLMLLIALAVKLDSPGPILYFQQRIGYAANDKVYYFQIIKYRTMRVGAEDETGAVLASEDDSRITRLGRILRNTRLDEIPQFWQVITGQLSIVGPRPERPELAMELEDEYPLFSERTQFVKPGITGLAQINMSYRDCADDIATKMAYDFAYALSLSTFRSWLVMDIKIIIRTVFLFLGMRSGGG